MKKEEILTKKQLRQSVFENRTNKTTLHGIREYFKRNHIHYNLKTTFEINALILGAFELYHDEKGILNN